MPKLPKMSPALNKLSADQKKAMAKFVFGAVTSLILGKMIKLERQAEVYFDKKVDERYDESAA